MRRKDVSNTSVSCVRPLERSLLIRPVSRVRNPHTCEHLYLFDGSKSHPLRHKVVGGKGLFRQACGHVVKLTLCRFHDCLLALGLESGSDTHLLCMTLPGMVATPRIKVCLGGEVHEPIVHTTLQGFRPQLSQLSQVREINWVEQLCVAAGAVEITIDLLIATSGVWALKVGKPMLRLTM